MGASETLSAGVTTMRTFVAVVALLLSAVSPLIISACAEVEKGMVGHWSFDADRGVVARDASPAGNHGTIRGARHVECGAGSALQFDGDDAFVDCGKPRSLDLRGPLAIAAWVRPDSVPDAERAICGKSQLSYALTYYKDGKIWFYIGSGSNAVNAPFEPQRWQHVAATFDGGTMAIYINGRPAASKGSAHATVNSDENFMIGRIRSVKEYPPVGGFAGQIDSVRVYVRALTADEVASLYASEAPLYAAASSSGARRTEVRAIALAEGRGTEQRVMLDAALWRPLPGEVRAAELPVHLTVFDGAKAEVPSTPPHSVRQTDEGILFEIVGRVTTTRSMKWATDVTPLDLSRSSYYVLRYRARGIERTYSPVEVVTVSGKDGQGKAGSAVLLSGLAVFNDARWHTVIGRMVAPFTAEALRVQVTTTDSAAFLEVGGISFHDHLPAIPAMPEAVPVSADAFQCLDLRELFNDTVEVAIGRVLEKEGMVTDGGLFTTDRTAVNGVPFSLVRSGNNIVRLRPDPSANDAEVEVMGQKTTRAYYKPVGRDDAITVKVGRKASEVFLVLVSELSKGGGQYAIAPRPPVLNDISTLAVELRYADGDSDWAFPYSLADRGYDVRRMCGAYAVPADPGRELESISVHNRVFEANFDLAAVTLNVSGERVVPGLASEPERILAPSLPSPAAREPFVRREGDVLTLGNTWYEVTLNCASGLSIERLVNRYSPAPVSLAPSSGIEVVVGDTLLTGRAFATREIRVDGNSAMVRLRSNQSRVPLELVLNVAVDDSPQLRLNLSAVNVGAGPLRADVRFPILRGLRLGPVEDTWIFFPKYRNLVSNETGFNKVAHGRSFPMQFMDLFNPRLGVGIALLTHKMDSAPLNYAAGKTAEGAIAFVESPGEFVEVPPRGTLRLPETCILVHTGDWHEATRVYREWLAAWYRPVHAQDKDWFNRLFVMRVHVTKKTYSWAVPFYNPVERKYLVDEALAVDTEYLGQPPQIVHIGGWVDYEHEYGGDFLHGDYAVKDYTGGADALRAMVRKFQDEHGIPVSFYTIPDRCGRETEVGKRMGDRIVIRRADGSAEMDDHFYYICPDSQEWREHYVEALARTVRETGIRVVYVDVFPLNSLCYSKEHGHEVPTNRNKASVALAKRIREVLPPEVAVWCEYPADEITTQYLDGVINYYCLYWHEYFGRQYDREETAPGEAPVALNLYRYVFPHLKQFVFLCGSETGTASDSKFPFFNGEGLYDISWFLYPSPHLDRMRKSLAVQTRYADCFSSDRPAMDVPTERAGVHANMFPGNGRTAWTLYNARYVTVRGPVIAVPHVEGARYYDAWNDRPLAPEIRDGKAVISLTLNPQDLGCVIQTFE